MTVCSKVTSAVWSANGHNVSLLFTLCRRGSASCASLSWRTSLAMWRGAPGSTDSLTSHTGHKKNTKLATKASLSSLAKRIRPQRWKNTFLTNSGRRLPGPRWNATLLGAVQWFTTCRWWGEGRGAAHRFNPVRKWIKILVLSQPNDEADLTKPTVRICLKVKHGRTS